jgi:hypothetical protein
MSLIHFLKHGRFTHDLIRGRTSAGHLTDQCSLCPYSRVLFGEALILDGPAHKPVEDWTRKGTAKTVRPNNIAEFPERMQR